MKKQHKGLRRTAALLSSTLLLAVMLLPCFVQPAAAYEAQGDTTWFITAITEYEGEEYYVIGPWKDGSLYYANVEFSVLDRSSANIDVDVPGLGQKYFGREVIYMAKTLSVPRTGFYVDEDWLVHLSFGTKEYPYSLRLALIDSAAWPRLYYSGVSSSSTASRVYSLYCTASSSGYHYSNLGVEFDDYNDIVVSLDEMALFVPQVAMSQLNGSLETETILVQQSIAGGYSADIVPLVWGSFNSTGWTTGTMELAYEYLCPVSKLGDYAVGDAFPRSEDLDIDAILDALDTLQVQYTDTMQYVGQISPSDLIGFDSMLNSTNSAADNYFGQTVGAVDSETISPWFTDNPFMAVIGMIVCIGFVGMVLKKAVT